MAAEIKPKVIQNWYYTEANKLVLIVVWNPFFTTAGARGGQRGSEGANESGINGECGALSPVPQGLI